MKTTRIVSSLAVVTLLTSGLVATGIERSSASIIASVTITSPEAGATVTGDVNVEAQAYGQQIDPPQKIKFFIDQRKKPAATVECLINLADPSAYCGANWIWHSSNLVGKHSLSAQVVLLDGALSDRSQAVDVTVQGQTHVVPHHAKHPVSGHKMLVSGYVRTVGKGHHPARHLPLTVSATPAGLSGHTFHLKTNKHGYYVKKIRAITNTTVTVQPAATRRYVSPEARTYIQRVHGRPRCGLSPSHVRVKQQAILRCHLSHLPVYSKYAVQSLVHGKWRRARGFQTTRANRTKIYIALPKPRTLTLREIFPTSTTYARSHSNVVKLHVT